MCADKTKAPDLTEPSAEKTTTEKDNSPSINVVKEDEETQKTADPPSIEMLHKHIKEHFPTFNLTTLVVPEKKAVRFAKGVTPLQTPRSYYHERPPHSYSKGFTPNT